MRIIKNICVYCSSSDAIDPVFNHSAQLLGNIMASQRKNLVYGGAKAGAMGILAKNVVAGNGYVIGIIPEIICEKGIAFSQCSQLIVTKNMRERKARMEEISDAFIAFPGGFGTLDEILEIITLKQLGIIDKPVVFLNVDGFFNTLLVFFEQLFLKQFTRAEFRELYYVADSPDDALRYINNYQSFVYKDKWHHSLKFPETDLKDIECGTIPE